jgi:tetratricopeptide (TPR) repeat protein
MGENNHIPNAAEKIFIQKWHPYFWIILFCSLVYWQTIFFNYTDFDDRNLITHDQAFLSKLSNIPKAFTRQVFPNQTYLPYYRPILTVSFMFDMAIGKDSSYITIGHMTNITLHILTCILLFIVLIKLSYKKELALLFSLFFAMHPSLVQAIAWVPGRNDSLLAVFILLSFLSAIKFTETRKWKYYIGYCVFFALALFTKESALVFIILTILYLYLIKQEKLLSFNIKAFSIGLIIITIYWGLLKTPALEANPIKATIWYALNGIIMSFHEIIIHIGKLLFPVNLSAIPMVQDSTHLYGWIAIMLLAVFLWVSKDKRPRFIIFGLSWFILFLLPCLVIHQSSTFGYEHRVYTPFLGFIIILLETDIVKRFSLQNKISLLVGAIIICVFSAITFSRIPIFKDKVTFWKSLTKTSPSLLVAHHVVGEAYYEKGLLDEAEKAYKETLKIAPQAPLTHYYLGRIYLDKNMYQQAGEEFKAEVSVNRERDNILFKIGILYYQYSTIKEAEARELKSADKLKEAEAKSAESQKLLISAEESWQQAITVNPKIPMAHNNLGIIYMNKNMDKLAEAEFRKELDNNPTYDKALFNLGMIYSKQGRGKEAEELWKKVIIGNPSNIDSYYQLALYYASQKEVNLVDYCVKQLEQNGSQGNIEAYRYLILFYYKQKDNKQVQYYINFLQQNGISVPADFLNTLERKEN